MQKKLRIAVELLVALWCALCVGSYLFADCQSYLTRTGVSSDARMGYSAAVVGDIDADSIDEFIIGAPGKNGATASNSQAWTDSSGHVHLYSGATGNLIRSHEALRFPYNTPNGELGFSVAAAGDVDADGVPDYIVGSPTYTDSYPWQRGRAVMISGSSGNTIGSPFDGTFQYSRTGYSVAGLGDVNGDSRSEVLVGAPGTYQIPGRVYVLWLNGSNWQVLDTITGGTGTYEFGKDVSGVSDLSGDGIPDILVAQNSPTQRKVFIFDGSTRDRIDSIANFGSVLTTPLKVRGIGDVNGDDYGDFVVGFSKPSGSNGEVQLYSGQNRSLLHTYTGSVPGFGISVSTAGDFDNDNIPDVLIGQKSGSMYVYSCDSTKNYALLRTMSGSGDFGTAVAGPEGTDNDGYGLTIAGAPTSNSATIFSCGFPEVDFSGSPLHGIPPVTVNFQGVALTTDITAWSWSFGDDSTSSLQNPSHVYDNVGAYTVSLVATGFNGADTVAYSNYVSFADQYACGDVDGDGFVDISDSIYLIGYIFGGGPAPIGSGDVDCSAPVDISDCVYLIDYIFGGGTPPCDPDGDGIPEC